MNFTQEPKDPSMMGTDKKGSTREELDKGKAKIEKTAKNIANKPEVVAATQAAKDGAKRAKDGVLDLFGLKDKEQPQAQMPYRGGKRRRKSRRKKRTKRRRKSRRKKRRTKRRRKSRRKRRR